MINADEKGCQRFTGAGGCGNQRMLSGMYGGPTGSLHLGRLTQLGPEPFLHDRMKRLQRHGINQILRLPTSRVNGRKTGLLGKARDSVGLRGQEIVEMRPSFL